MSNQSIKKTASNDTPTSRFISHGGNIINANIIRGALVVSNTSGAKANYGSICLDHDGYTESWHKTKTLEEAVDSFNSAIDCLAKGVDYLSIKDRLCIPLNLIKKAFEIETRGKEGVYIIGMNEAVLSVLPAREFTDITAVCTRVNERLTGVNKSVIDLSDLQGDLQA